MNRIFDFFRVKTEEAFRGRTVKKNGTLIALVITLLFFVVSEYFTLLPINFRNIEFVVFFTACFVGFNVLRCLFTLTFDLFTKGSIVITLLLATYIGVGQLFSFPIFHADEYQSQLTVDTTADFFKDNEKVNYQSIPVVDRYSAERLGDRKMGEIVDYVSQFEVDDEYDQINYKDKPYRVTTISYSNIFKWLSNHKDGLPAYITVDMVTQESEVVRLKEGMKYSNSDLFFRNISRYLCVNYPTKMFETPSFEIDDNGTPYWIASVYDYKVGVFGGRDIVGAVLVNACTGEHKYYDISEVPTWIDCVYPTSLLLTQLENWGLYTNGYFNTLFSQKGVLMPTDGYNYIAMNDDVYLYTGLTSVSSDASNVGFALINMRTKEAKYYAISGAEEYSAMSSAEGKVQNLQYVATFPILVNAGGEPTYFMSLKDSAGLVKCYAFVSVKNYQLVAVGNSVAEAEKAYYQLLSDNDFGTSDLQAVTLETKIANIKAAVVEGNTHYYLTLEGSDKIFIAPVSLNDYLPLAVAGDEVTVKYFDDQSKSEVIISIEFKS